MKNNIIEIEEIPNETLLTRKQVANVLKIGLSTLDALIKDDELPRVRYGKHVYIMKRDIEKYILSHRTGGFQ